MARSYPVGHSPPDTKIRIARVREFHLRRQVIFIGCNRHQQEQQILVNITREAKKKGGNQRVLPCRAHLFSFFPDVYVYPHLLMYRRADDKLSNWIDVRNARSYMIM